LDAGEVPGLDTAASLTVIPSERSEIGIFGDANYKTAYIRSLAVLGMTSQFAVGRSPFKCPQIVTTSRAAVAGNSVEWTTEKAEEAMVVSLNSSSRVDTLDWASRQLRDISFRDVTVRRDLKGRSGQVDQFRVSSLEGRVHRNDQGLLLPT
jgi:hypothetical protein